MNPTLAPARPATPIGVYLAAVAGILAVSTAAIFILYAQREGMPSLVIAAGRLTLSALLLTPFALAQHWPRLRALSRADLVLAAASGFFLAIHFATWIASLEYTSVLISVVFVSTSPLWVALLEFVFFRVRPTVIIGIGLALAFVGGVIIALGGASGDETTLALVSGDGGVTSSAIGVGLALVGGVAIAVYLVIGRKLRAGLPLLPYIWLVYGFAALFLLLMVAFAGLPLTTYTPTSYLWVLALALIPQLIGHTAFNYALRYLSATWVSLTTQMEPIGSAIFALILFQQLPTVAQIVGSVIILVGVVLVSQKRS